ncbi:MAG TPA: M12 family metallo-peptidase, partial [Bacteroidia bacterium]|nr:M12 family metallo-peptidase [Bacteroidia bacterium]
MKKIKLLFQQSVLIVCLLGVTLAHAQNRNRLSVMVQNETFKTVFTPVNLFKLTTVANAEQFVNNGTGLTVDATQLGNLFASKPTAVSLEIPTANGRTFTLDVVKQNILSNDFKVSTQNQNQVSYTPGVYYRGIIKGDFNSIAAVSIFNDDVMIMFSNAEGNFNLGKVNNQHNQYFLYNDHLVVNKPAIDCSTTDGDSKSDISIEKNGGNTTSSVVCKTVKCYYEADFAMYNAFSSNTTTTSNYVTSIFNVKSTLYANDGMNIEISEIKVWTATDPYASFTSTSTTNNAFITQTGSTFNGDMANLLTTRNLGGGIAQGFSGLCNKQQAHCTSMIYTTYSPFPTYSWTVMVITHEMGHLMGSRHTHACVWNGNNTAIDGCSGFVEGSCTLPGIPSGGGTIMSYCHQQSVGINLNLGFGPQPGGLLLNNVNTATCLTGSGASTPTGLNTTAITSSSATLNWNAVSGATQYTVEYKLATASTYTLLGTVTSNSAALSGLTSSTAYDWRVSADCSPFSAPATFTTSGLAGCGVPVGLGADNISSSTARIFWSDYVGAVNYKTR